eukprot:gene10351-biopygen8029
MPRETGPHVSELRYTDSRKVGGNPFGLAAMMGKRKSTMLQTMRECVGTMTIASAAIIQPHVLWEPLRTNMRNSSTLSPSATALGSQAAARAWRGRACHFEFSEGLAANPPACMECSVSLRKRCIPAYH